MWVEAYVKAKEALLAGEIERFFKSTMENSRDMRVSYSGNNAMQWFKWLEGKATMEAMGYEEGAVPSIVMGGSG